MHPQASLRHRLTVFGEDAPFFPNDKTVAPNLRARIVKMSGETTTGITNPLPRPDHVVVLIEEDHSYSGLFGPPSPVNMQTWSVVLPGMQTWDPNLRNLETQSASFTNAHSVGNTNAVDYQTLFSGLNPTGKSAISPDAPRRGRGG